MNEFRGQNYLDRQSIPVEKGPFSRKIISRVTDAFNQSPFLIVGSDNNGSVVHSRHLLPSFNRADYLPSGDPLRDAVFNAQVPFVMNVLLGNNEASRRGYINSIGGNDMNNLSQIAIDLAAKKSDEAGIVIRMVYGATIEMPLRAISYPLPVLQMMDSLRGDFKRGITPPQLQIVFANHLSSALNGIPYDQVATQTELFVNAEKTYIAQFFPDLADRVVFLEDVEANKGSEIDQTLQMTAQLIAEQGQDHIKDALLQKGINPSTYSNIVYGAAHLLFHDVVPEGLLHSLLQDQPDVIDPKTIISVGGLQEQFFYHLRSHLKPLVDLPFPYSRTLQLFTRHHVPPYYMAKGGDHSLQDTIDGKLFRDDLATTARIDLQYLQRTSAQHGDYEAFIATLQKGIV